MTKIELLRSVFAYADTENMLVALARPMTSLATQSDLDIFIRPKDVSKFIACIRNLGTLGITCSYARPDGITLHIYGVIDGDRTAIKVDLITSCTVLGLPYRSITEILNRRMEKEGFYILDDIDQAFVLFMTHGVKHKNALKENYWKFIAQTRRFHKDVFASALIDNFGIHRVPVIEDMLDTKSLSKSLRRDFVLHALNVHFLGSVANLLFYSLQRFVGLWGQHYDVAFYGMDGAGKTTLIHGLKQDLAGTVTAIRHPHALPAWPWKKDMDSTITMDDPHARPKRSPLSSFIKLIYFVMRYRLISVWPSYGVTLNLYDRHYYDIIADPRRYRFTGSDAVVKFLGKFIPNPIASIVVDVNAKTAHERKKEVSFAEAERQSKAYKELASSLNNPCLVNGEWPQQTIRNVALKHILTAMEKQVP